MCLSKLPREYYYELFQITFVFPMQDQLSPIYQIEAQAWEYIGLENHSDGSKYFLSKTSYRNKLSAFLFVRFLNVQSFKA